jgi:hypothetical protein
MRTTLTLDDDVAVELERLRRRTSASFRQVVNDTLRAGLRARAAPVKRARAYRIRPASVGRCLLPSLDNVAEILAIAEGEAHR